MLVTTAYALVTNITGFVTIADLFLANPDVVVSSKTRNISQPSAKSSIKF
ncbi:MAG: hypothetical protein V7K38_26705 [Nostoc sp.]